MAIQQLKAAYLQIIRAAGLWLLLLAAALPAACSKQEKEAESGYNPPAMADRCVVLYMPGRNLDYFYRQNLNGIARAVSSTVPGNGRMLVCWQPDNSRTAVLQEIYYDTQSRQCETRTLKEYDSFAAESPAGVAALLSDAVTAAPARQYGLIIGCHGKAWVSRTSGNLSMNSADPDRQPEDLWIPAPGALPTRSFGDSGHELEIQELAEVITGQRVRFDYLIFDACFMANIETLYDLRECTDYVIAAPCEIIGQGFPYDRAMPWFFTDGGKGRDLTKVCEAFWNFYMNDATTQSGCISLAVMSEMEGMKEVMRRINAAPKKSYAEELQSYEGMSSHIFYDLGHWVELACGDAKLKEDFKAQLDKAFPKAARLSTPGFYSAYNGRMNPVAYYSGVSFSEPSDKYVEENKQTSWYRDTH